MSVPSRAAAAALLVSLDPPAWHLRHARAVAEVAGWLAARCAAGGEPVDRALVEAAALLHDVDKVLPGDDPARALPHGEGSAAWLAARGHAELAGPIAAHPVTRLLGAEDRGGRVARHGAPRGARRRVRRQARRPAPRADGRRGSRTGAAATRRAGRHGGTTPAPGERAECARAAVCARAGVAPGRGPSAAAGPAVPSPAGRAAPAEAAGVTGPRRSATTGATTSTASSGRRSRSGRRAAGPGGEPPARVADDRRARPGPASIAERVATATLFGGGTLVDRRGAGAARPLEGRARRPARRDRRPSRPATPSPSSSRSTGRPAGRSRSRISPPPSPRPAARSARSSRPARAGWPAGSRSGPASVGVRLERGAAEALARKVGAFVREGDVDRRRQGRLAVAELEKLAVYRARGRRFGPRTSRRSSPTPFPARRGRSSTPSGSRRAREAADLLERLLETTPEPVLVAVLHRRIRELLQVARPPASGASRMQVTARALKLKEYPGAQAVGRRAWRGARTSSTGRSTGSSSWTRR